jgi:alpha-galactosidase
MGLGFNANGYQSWSESPFIDQLYYKKNLNYLVQNIFRLKWYGDYSFTYEERKKRWMHSHLFLNLTEDGETRLFLGDLMPYDSYSWFTVDYNKNTITMTSDLEGLILEEGDGLTVVRMLESDNQAAYWKFLSFEERKSDRITGFTSWYNYYTNISTEILEKNMDAIEKSGIPIDVFQIDDGYFTAVGDWLSPNERFPEGMGPVAGKIKARGWKPGIWLAPFVCERKSRIFREKSNWIQRDSKNRLQTAGWNPNWSGVFYPLDIYNQEFREYLFEVFNTMKEVWQYSFFKLDFLYAACLQPGKGKTRAMIMSDAMDLLNELTKGALFLSCGVPIGPAMGKCDYARIGADISHGMEDKFLRGIGYRERVSTFSAIGNTRTRSFMDGHAFGNDPDVFILRNSKEIKMSVSEKELLFKTNLGNSSLVFFSDDVSKYSDDMVEKVDSAFKNHRNK